MSISPETQARLQQLLALEPSLPAQLSAARDQETGLHLLQAAALRQGLSLDEAELAACLAASPTQALDLPDACLEGVAGGISPYTANCRFQPRPDPFEGMTPVIGLNPVGPDLDPGAMITLD